MAVVAARGRARAEQAARMQWREQEPRSPEMPPRPRPARAAVVYYLSRNGHLEHPHFMEVALSCPRGLYLRDVIDRLDALRGKGMARMYSWASKRSYRNGYVWHDLADDDYIHPVHGREYVLKGTEHQHPAPLPLPDAAAVSSSSSETTTSSPGGKWEHGHGKPTTPRKKSASAEQYVVYKGEERAADAATQTEDSRHQRRASSATQDELTRAETTSPPTASTSPETLTKAEAGRARSSSVLMQLISCGSVAVKDAAHATAVTLRPRPPTPPSAAKKKVGEDKEYFSGSIVETAKRSPADDARQEDAAGLRRTSSYNADRVIKLELAKDAGDLHDRCMPRRPPKSKKDGGYLVVDRLQRAKE